MSRVLKRPSWGWGRRWWSGPLDALQLAAWYLAAAGSATALYGLIDALAWILAC